MIMSLIIYLNKIYVASYKDNFKTLSIYEHLFYPFVKVSRHGRFALPVKRLNSYYISFFVYSNETYIVNSKTLCVNTSPILSLKSPEIRRLRLPFD